MERKTNMRSGDVINPPVAAATKIEMGKLVCANATGYAVEGSAAATLAAMGRAEATVDNTLGADGALTVPVRRGVFFFANSAGDAVVQADVGHTVFIEDDQTVCKTATGKSAAGLCVELASDGVWVEVGMRRTAAETMSLIGASHKIVAAGLHVWAGGAAATDSIAVVGLVATDIVLVNVSTRGSGNPTSVIGVNDAGNDQIDLVMDQNGENNVTKIAYAVLRA